MITHEMIEAAARAIRETSDNDDIAWGSSLNEREEALWRARAKAGLKAGERVAWRPIDDIPIGTEAVLASADGECALITFVWGELGVIAYAGWPWRDVLPTHWRPLPAPPEVSDG